MSNIYLYILLAVVAGAMMPTQAATNNKMAVVLGNSPILAAFISFFVGTIGLLVYLLIGGATLGNIVSAKNAPAFVWIGGLLGAFFVTSTVVLVPRLGVALTFSLIVAGQMLVTLVIDHFGLLDVPVKEVSFARVGGILLIIAGVVLIRKF
jgi:transporter family-2 protein